MLIPNPIYTKIYEHVCVGMYVNKKNLFKNKEKRLFIDLNSRLVR